MTDEERLQHERLIADIQTIRGSGSRSSWWREFMESTVVAALLTAIVGTLGAGIVIARYQTRAHLDELALADRKARTEAQQHAAERALSLLAEGEYHARGRYSVTRRRFQLAYAASADVEALKRQREKIISGSNDFEEMWPAQKKTLEGLLKQTFPKDKAVADTWIVAAASLDALLVLARNEYDTYLKNPAVTVDRPQLPDDVDTGLRKAINSFTAAVELAASRDE